MWRYSALVAVLLSLCTLGSTGMDRSLWANDDSSAAGLPYAYIIVDPSDTYSVGHQADALTALGSIASTAYTIDNLSGNMATVFGPQTTYVFIDCSASCLQNKWNAIFTAHGPAMDLWVRAGTTDWNMTNGIGGKLFLNFWMSQGGSPNVLVFPSGSSGSVTVSRQGGGSPSVTVRFSQLPPNFLGGYSKSYHRS